MRRCELDQMRSLNKPDGVGFQAGTLEIVHQSFVPDIFACGAGKPETY